MSEHPLLRADEILRVLTEESVKFVLIGGLAAQVHGSPSLTGDIDICHALDSPNVERLARALQRLVAIQRALPIGVVAPIDRHSLRAGDVFTLATRFGDLDLLAHPDPGFDYDRLRIGAIAAEIFDIGIWVASLDDLIAMKRAAGRPKDRVELEILGALREEIDHPAR